MLIERGKWAHSRLLRFDFAEILERAQRAEDATIKATAALLHRSSLLPGEGAQSLLDGLDDNSHRHAFAVSTDLKYAMRESIELIGNEAIRYLREVSRERVYNLDDQLADKLGLECVRLHVPVAVPLLHRGAAGAGLRPAQLGRLSRGVQPRTTPGTWSWSNSRRRNRATVSTFTRA